MPSKPHFRYPAPTDTLPLLADCDTDTELTNVDFSYIEKEFGYPFYTVHRASLQKALVQGAKNSGVVQLHLGYNVIEYDFDQTRFKVSRREAEGEPEWIQADVLLCADGIKSKARGQMLERTGGKDDVVDTGQAAYRILVKREDIKEDPELVPFFEGSHSYRWIGPKRHIIVSSMERHSMIYLISLRDADKLAPRMFTGLPDLVTQDL